MRVGRDFGEQREAVPPSPTWLLPPVLSCTRLRDMEQLMAKHWKKPPRKLERPRAISSCKDRAAVREALRIPGLQAVSPPTGKFPHVSEHHLVAVHFVAMLQGKNLTQGDADGVTHYGDGESVAHHLPKVGGLRDHRRLQPTAKAGRWSSGGGPVGSAVPRHGRPRCPAPLTRWGCRPPRRCRTWISGRRHRRCRWR